MLNIFPLRPLVPPPHYFGAFLDFPHLPVDFSKFLAVSGFEVAIGVDIIPLRGTDLIEVVHIELSNEGGKVPVLVVGGKDFIREP